MSVAIWGKTRGAQNRSRLGGGPGPIAAPASMKPAANPLEWAMTTCVSGSLRGAGVTFLRALATEKLL